MKSLFIMGMSRGGTTVTLDLFRFVPGITILNEASIADMMTAIHQGIPLVWKSPHDCLKGKALQNKFPDVPQLYVIRDGRQNLAEHKHYLEVHGIDPSFAPYQGPRGFATLWNKFAYLATEAAHLLRLEDLISGTGLDLVKGVFGQCEYQGFGEATSFWLNYVNRQDSYYPGEAVNLNTPHWSEILTDREIGWLSPDFLKAFGYE